MALVGLVAHNDAARLQVRDLDAHQLEHGGMRAPSLQHGAEVSVSVPARHVDILGHSTHPG